MMGVMSKTSSGMTLLSMTCVVALAILGLVLFTAITNAQIIWQTESQLGYALSCAEAYNQRQIDAYFYPERQFQGNVLYLYSLISPVMLLSLVGLIVVLGIQFTREQGMLLKRFRAGLIACGVILLVGLLAYAPVIYTIACAIE